ncbi:MAG: hypothetical protein J6S67_25040 [Methanobrevibacter sp.]|nr:hypothetical protein [Methanobrevibacter sp.]
MENKRINYGLIVTLVVTVLGWGVTFGVCKNKIETGERAIERLEQNQQQYQLRTDTSMQSIYSQLAGLNAKMDLLLDGRINAGM